jgi:acyl-CoA hydrolase
VGDLITLRATVNAAWRTCTAYLTMVALGEQERALPVPSLTPVTSEERRRHREANLRREIRLAQLGDVGRVN